MTDVTVSSVARLGRLKNTAVKSQLKHKEKQKIAKAIGEHIYLLDNGRTVMDAHGVKNALGMDNESAMLFFEQCKPSQLYHLDDQQFVYTSTVFKKANTRVEQPYAIKIREKSRYGRDLFIETIKPNENK